MKQIVNVPLINTNDESVILVRWHVPDGGRVEVGAPLIDVETTKAVVTVEAEHAGWVRHAAKEGVELAIGVPLAVIVSEEAELAEVRLSELGPKPAGPVETSKSSMPESPAVMTPKSDVSAPKAAPGGTANFTRLSPRAAALAEKLGWSAEALARAQLGLVTAADLQELAAAAGGASVTAKEPVAATRDGPALRSERPPMPKRAEIDALQLGAQGGLRSSLTVYFDSAALRSDEGGPGVLTLILHEAARLLVTRPRFTAFFDAGQIHFYDAVRLGVAIDQGEGLRVVTLRDAEKQEPAELAARLGELALDYLERRLRPEDVQDATFTVTDLSGFDVLHFEPLINGRQSAILAVGGDSALPGYPMSLTLAFDHRVLTGREVAEFLKALRDALLARMTAVPAVESEPEPACCDRCLVDLKTYYARFGAVGIMHHYARVDGSTGLICHSCLATS